MSFEKSDKKAIVLLSGGLDSSTVIALAKKQGFEIYALSFRYQQKNHTECEKASEIAKKYSAAEHKILEISLESFGGSSLTTNKNIEKDRSLDEIGQRIPSTYVPARNTLFLSYALAWADVVGASDIFIGVNALDFSGYPDCRPEYIQAFQEMANLALKRTTEGGENITINTPLLNLNKQEIIKLGLKLEVDYSATSTCYEPNQNGLACGRCDACILRKNAFKQLGLVDPLDYQTI